MFFHYLSTQHISYQLPDNTYIFKDLSFSLTSEHKAALIGKNGVGKSTLLKVLAGNLSCTEGVIKTDAKITYMPQKIQNIKGSIADVLGIERIMDALKKIEAGSVEQKHFDIIEDNWDIEAKARKELANFGLGEIDLNRNIQTFSGGEIIKILFAKTFLTEPDFILFDEPTNNLDYNCKHQFIDRVLNYDKGIFIVSHDRELLNKMDKIYELTEKDVKIYGGNYDFYKEEKQKERAVLEAKLKAAEKEKKELKKEQQKLQKDTAKKTREGKKGIATHKYTRMHAGLKRMQAQDTASKKKNNIAEKEAQTQSKLKEIKAKQEDDKHIKINFNTDAKNTNKVLFEGKYLAFGYGEKLLFNGINLSIRYGDRISITGDNGSGKSTLIKLIMGKLKPKSGRAELKTNPVYLDQKLELLDRDKSILENFLLLNPTAQKNDAHNVLAQFLFRNEDAKKTVKDLSGGELLKATLACVLGNSKLELLILDEPTNNLDIDSIEILENALTQYPGALLIVTHDKKFLKNININKTIEL